MGIELFVGSPGLPGNLLALWEADLGRRGFQVEICPDADLAAHRGFLPFRVAAVPSGLLREPLRGPIIGGFELSTGPTTDGLDFYGNPAVTVESTLTGYGNRVDIVLQHLCAATLAAHTGGTMVDPRSGLRATGAEAWPAADRWIAGHLAGADDGMLVAFPTWAELGVTVPSDEMAPSGEIGPLTEQSSTAHVDPSAADSPGRRGLFWRRRRRP